MLGAAVQAGLDQKDAAAAAASLSSAGTTTVVMKRKLDDDNTNSMRPEALGTKPIETTSNAPSAKKARTDPP
jgi:hypothetical protein